MLNIFLLTPILTYCTVISDAAYPQSRPAMLPIVIGKLLVSLA